MQLNVIKTLTVRGKTEGMGAVRAELDGVSASQDKVAKSGEAMARSTETSARRQLSAANAYDRLIEKNDRMVWAQRQLDREMRIVNSAFEIGHIDTMQLADATTLLQGKFERLATAERAARGAIDATSHALDQQAAAMMRVNAANDNTRGSLANVTAQFQDVAVTAAMGMNPIMIALQQGTQLSSVLMTMQNPLRGLLGAFMGLINPVSLLTIGFIALSAVAIQWFMGAKEDADKASTALEEHNKWLDIVLAGYGDVRDAAKEAVEEAMKLPKAAAVSELEVGRNTALDTLKKDLAAINQEIAIVRASFGDLAYASNFDEIDASKWLTEISLSSQSTAAEIEALREQLILVKNDGSLSAIARENAANLLPLVEVLQVTRAQVDSLGVSINDMANMTDLSDMQTFEQIVNDTRLGLTFAERAALAAAWAIANSGDAAIVAASQYGTAAGAANAYANAMFRLGSLIPEVAAAQAQFGQLKQAETDYSAAIRENQALLDARGISMDEFARRQEAANDLYQRAQEQVTGLTDATVSLDAAERDAYIGSLPAKEAAVARLNDAHAARVAALEASVAAGANEADVQTAISRSAEVLAQEIANTNAQFEQTAASAGGAGKALRDAEKDFASFASTADKLAEALFPAEYARREAAELMALLDQYRDKLDEFQIAGIEGEISNLNSAADQGLRRLEDRAAETGDQVMKTLGSVLGSLFEGPMDDMDAFFDKAMAGFAQIGQQNLAKLFEGGGGSGATGEGGNFFETLFKGVKAGSKEGTFAGAQGGIMSLSSMGGMASAGLGGLGIGYQAQDPMMGALGGAAQGAMAGMAGGPIGMLIGGVIGGLGGLIGGLMGASKALQEAQQKLEDNRLAIQQFIAAANGEQISRYAKTLADFNKQAAELMALAQKAGDDALVAQLRAANDNVVGTLGKEFTKEIEASINRLRGDDFLNQASAALDAYNMRMKDAVMLGVDASGAMTELSLTLRKIIEDGDLTAEQLARLTSLFPSLAAELASIVASMPPPGSMTLDDAQSAVDRARQDLRESYEAEATTLREVIDRNRQFIKSLESFKASLRLDLNLSGLSPMERFLEAQSQFESVSAAALAGDADAMAKLEAVSRAYLEEAKGYYASSEQYFEIFGRVESVLDQALANAEGALTGAEQQLAALEQQVSLLIDIDRSVKSVADAIYALTVAVANLSTVEGGGYVPLPGFATGGSFTVAGASGVDQNVLSINGRAAARVGRGEIVDIRPPQSGNDNSSAAVLNELHALREEVAMLRGVTAAGAQAVVKAASGTTEAVQTGNRGASQASLRRPS